MAVESLPTTLQTFNNRSNNPIFSNVHYIPEHLKRRVLKSRIHNGEKIPENLWTERGRAVEIYTADVIKTQKETVKNVYINTLWDQKGPDGDIFFHESIPTESVKLEVKSSSRELREGKQKIRDEFLEEQIRSTLIGPWLPERMAAELKKKGDEWNRKSDEEKEKIISQRLTDLNLILINGGEKDRKEKTPEEILEDSFYPQLNRISQKELKEQVSEESGQLVLFPRIKPI